ncbi:MAG TPA: hypothetical protein VFA51_05025 [Candidatus Udaeobacter sp.]|nr:hypothetical protein [Candidatus Udaeobacter sp.]
MSAPKSSSPAVATYVESDGGVALESSPSARLLFSALLYHGPGFEEQVQYFGGSSKCGGYDVLWCHSDWLDDTDTSAAAWLPKGILTGRALWEALLAGYWNAEKTAYESDAPNFNEITQDGQSALSSDEVWEIVERIWPSKQIST